MNCLPLIFVIMPTKSFHMLASIGYAGTMTDVTQVCFETYHFEALGFKNKRLIHNLAHAFVWCYLNV